MTKYELNRNQEEDDIVEALLRLPTKNLETRIKELEKEVQTRQKLSQEALLVMGTRQLNLEERVWHLRYAMLESAGSRTRDELNKQIQNLEAWKLNEMIACFRDLSGLRERLQQSREELEKARQKLKLVKPDRQERDQRL